MSSKVYTSGSLQDLEQACLAGLENVQTTSLAPTLVLVPSNLLALYLRRVLALQEGSRGHANLRFMTLVDLARSFCSAHLLMQGKIEPPPLLAERLFEQVVAAAISEPGYFSKLRRKGELEPSLLSAITDLKEACITPSELSRWAATAPLAKEGSDKLKELARVYLDYNKRLETFGFVDRNDILIEATQFIPPASETPYFVYGFYDFNPLQKRFIAALLRQQEALFFFPWRDAPAFEYALPSLTWLKNLGCEHVTLAEKEVSGVNELAYYLFNPAARKPAEQPIGSSLTIVSAPGEAREVSEIVRELLRWVDQEGIHFSDISILLRSSEPYAPLLVEALSRLRVPFYLNGGSPLLKTRAGQSFKLLLAMLRENFSRLSVMEFVSYAPLAARYFNDGAGAQSETALWDLFSIQASIVGGKAEWRERLDRLQSRMKDGQRNPEDSKDGNLNSTLRSLERFQAFLVHLFDSLDSIPTEGRWSDMARSFATLLRRLFAASPESEQVADEIESLARFDLLDESVDLERFSRVAATSLTAARVNTDGFGKGGIFIGDVMSARGLSFKAVIVPGMVEKFFPRSWRQDPILLDHERQYISEGLGKELAQKNKQYDEERLLFAFTLMAARERILFSFPRMEMLTARERIPSFFLLRLMEAATGKAASFKDFAEWDRLRRVALSRLFPHHANEALDGLEYDLFQADHVVTGSDRFALAYLAGLSPFFDAALTAEAHRWGKKLFTPFDGVLQGNKAKVHLQRLYGGPRVSVSATALESYARCPFRFFIERLLGLSVLEEPDPFARLSPLDRGSLIHDILCRFLCRLKEEKKLPMNRQPLDLLQLILTQVTDHVLAAYEKEKATGFPLLWQLDKEEASEDLKGWLEIEYREDGAFVPTELERNFSCPFPLDAKEWLHLRGRIDRIDINGNDRCARIIDYKTGRPQRLEDGEFKGGEALQLPIYLHASKDLLNDIEPTEASYYYVSRGGKYQKQRFTREPWGKKLETLRAIMAGLIGEIRNGLFIARPASCRNCEYPWICTPAAGVLFDRKSSDPRIGHFERIKEIP